MREVDLPGHRAQSRARVSAHDNGGFLASLGVQWARARHVPGTCPSHRSTNARWNAERTVAQQADTRGTSIAMAWLDESGWRGVRQATQVRRARAPEEEPRRLPRHHGSVRHRVPYGAHDRFDAAEESCFMNIMHALA